MQIVIDKCELFYAVLYSQKCEIKVNIATQGGAILEVLHSDARITLKNPEKPQEVWHLYEAPRE